MNGDASTILLEVRGLGCERDGRVLFENLDFALRGGEILRVCGPNGSGKTTLLRALAGLSERCSGSIRWLGSEARNCRYEMFQDSLYLGHDPGIKLGLSAQENLRWYAAVAGRTQACSVDTALATLGLAGCMHVPARQLSVGQRRRAGLARLLITRASLWILDEPFTAIDQTGVTDIEVLIAAHADSGGAVVLSTHQTLHLGRDVATVVLGQPQRDTQ